MRIAEAGDRSCRFGLYLCMDRVRLRCDVRGIIVIGLLVGCSSANRPAARVAARDPVPVAGASAPASPAPPAPSTPPPAPAEPPADAAAARGPETFIDKLPKPDFAPALDLTQVSAEHEKRAVDRNAAGLERH